MTTTTIFVMLSSVCVISFIALKPSNETNNKAYEFGKVAAKYGASAESNPYVGSNYIKAEDWLAGWLAGKNESGLKPTVDRIRSTVDNFPKVNK